MGNNSSLDGNEQKIATKVIKQYTWQGFSRMSVDDDLLLSPLELVPEDVVCEIFTYLPISYLLALMRCSKSMFNLAASVQVWNKVLVRDYPGLHELHHQLAMERLRLREKVSPTYRKKHDRYPAKKGESYTDFMERLLPAPREAVHPMYIYLDELKRDISADFYKWTASYNGGTYSGDRNIAKNVVGHAFRRTATDLSSLKDILAKWKKDGDLVKKVNARYCYAHWQYFGNYSASHDAGIERSVNVYPHFYDHLTTDGQANMFFFYQGPVPTGKSFPDFYFPFIGHTGDRLRQVTPDENKGTLLHWAAMSGNVEAVEELLKIDGIEVNVGVTKQKVTPMVIALVNVHWDVVKLLEAAGGIAGRGLDGYVGKL